MHSTNRDVLILGGGQLGYFLCQAARHLDRTTTVVCPEPDAPATAAADRVVQTTLDDVDQITTLARSASVTTFEVESVDQRVLDALRESSNPATAAQASVLRLLQDKLKQKQWLQAESLPTAPFDPISPNTHPLEAQRIARGLGYPCVQKTRVGGYDGKGVQIIRQPDAMNELWPTRSLLEAFVPRAIELTVLVARNLSGDTAVYAPVQNFMNDDCNVLELTVAPAPLSAETANAATSLAHKTICRLGGVGVYAVEMFLTESNALLVNEISARVHNSGHHTLESCVTSQFEQHVRAVLNMPLGSTEMICASAMMRNLITGITPHRALIRQAPHSSSSHHPTGTTAVHWYGKSESRKYRKMGHVTVTAGSLRDARAQMRSLVGDSEEAEHVKPQPIEHRLVPAQECQLPADQVA